MNEMLTPSEAARRLSVSRGHLMNLIRAGHLKAIDVGAGKKLPRYRIDSRDLEHYIESHGATRGSTPGAGGSSGESPSKR